MNITMSTDVEKEVTESVLDEKIVEVEYIEFESPIVDLAELKWTGIIVPKDFYYDEWIYARLWKIYR